MNLTGGAFVPGPYPRKGSAGKWPSGSKGASKWPSGSLAPTDKGYPASGLLECPLTTRIRKQLTGGGWNDSFVATIGQESCLHKLDDGSEACFAAAKRVGISNSAQVSNEQGVSAELPSGCSVQVNGTDVRVFFNTNADSTASCGSGTNMVEGAQDSLVNLRLSLSSSRGANITMSGPADSWFGIGFNTDVMTNSPWAIVIDGNGQVTERVLGDHAAGILLNNSVQIISHTVANGTRTVIMSRPLAGLTPQHHSFNVDKLSLDFINAIGSTPTFGYHKSKTVATITLWPTTPEPQTGGLFGLFNANTALATRNDWNGEVGFEFTPKQSLTVTALGRAASGELKAAARVNIWSVGSKALVTTGLVGPGSNTSMSDQGYAYVDLVAPISLKQGQQYYVTQTCTSGMPDKWTNTTANAPAANQELVSLGNGVFSPQGSPGVFPTQSEATEQFAGIVTLKLQVPPNPHPAPAAACVCAVPAAPFGKGTGTIQYLPTGEQIGFPPRCEPYPRETVLRDRNPTCDIR